MKYADLLHYADMNAPAHDNQLEDLIIGEFPSVYTNALRAEANAQGMKIEELCADILRGHVARWKEGREV